MKEKLCNKQPTLKKILGYFFLTQMLGLTQFGRKCDLIYQWCDKKKSEVAPVRPAVQKIQKINK